jgi:spore coat polysaccharide biosynthesis protein SpsF (cytidylyltransferase family)
MFPAMIVDAKPDRRHWRITVDTEEDYRLVHAVYEALYVHNPAFGYADLCRLFDAEPQLLTINAASRVAGVAAR